MTRRSAVAIALSLLSFFFVFGTAMSALTIVTLLFPGSFLEPMWRLNPDARRSFQEMGAWAILLMSIVGVACLLAAIGLAKRAEWGRIAAISVLVINVAGDVAGAVIRHDPRTLIGLPVAGAMIAFLLSGTVRRLFRRST